MFRSRGFTLIEMLIVLAVIAILAMVALPNTQDVLTRRQIAEALPLADIAKKPIASAWSLGHSLPVNNAAAGLPVADKIVNSHISAVTVQNGAIHITFGNSAHRSIHGKILSLRPAVVDGEPIVPVTWICGFAAAPDKMTIKGENKTDIAAGFLPAQCRGDAAK